MLIICNEVSDVKENKMVNDGRKKSLITENSMMIERKNETARRA